MAYAEAQVAYAAGQVAAAADSQQALATTNGLYVNNCSYPARDPNRSGEAQRTSGDVWVVFASGTCIFGPVCY